MTTHAYKATVTWTGDLGRGTSGYKDYSRDHEITVEGKPPLAGSSDASFRGDANRWNPEDTLLGSISSCHMLWFLHLASEAGWVVHDYVDHAEAVMQMNPDGSGQFTSATLHPEVTISSGDAALSESLHHKAHEMCFIARSLNFQVTCNPKVTTTASQKPLKN
ncbi:MAG: OsmC family protein, partial [Pseudomonadota bacterium]